MAFPSTSRYYRIETAVYRAEDGRLTPYLRRRFIPPADRYTVIQEYAVAEGDRLDNITHRYLGDAEQFWRVCDANNVLRPEELTEEIGRRIRITLPEGIPGTQNV